MHPKNNFTKYQKTIMTKWQNFLIYNFFIFYPNYMYHNYLYTCGVCCMRYISVTYVIFFIYDSGVKASHLCFSLSDLHFWPLWSKLLLPNPPPHFDRKDPIFPINPSKSLPLWDSDRSSSPHPDRLPVNASWRAEQEVEAGSGRRRLRHAHGGRCTGQPELRRRRRRRGGVPGGGDCAVPAAGQCGAGVLRFQPRRRDGGVPVQLRWEPQSESVRVWSVDEEAGGDL